MRTKAFLKLIRHGKRDDVWVEAFDQKLEKEILKLDIELSKREKLKTIYDKLTEEELQELRKLRVKIYVKELLRALEDGVITETEIERLKFRRKAAEITQNSPEHRKLVRDVIKELQKQGFLKNLNIL